MSLPPRSRLREGGAIQSGARRGREGVTISQRLDFLLAMRGTALPYVAKVAGMFVHRSKERNTIFTRI
jgi:hypothetical protein